MFRMQKPVKKTVRRIDVHQLLSTAVGSLTGAIAGSFLGFLFAILLDNRSKK